ncbi:MAG: TatD family deoxyribonuclease [Candidatus Cloacimonetes bacterium HGW-Cloacimonetes-2]|jgi:Tat protein secretion system quality control protein TatD with DNase activity|nr:MAG: TatD family deoxyribonuclease [Candidatus Cloacimonetes bacterium HGW-Cloacimonetes-2]
MNLIDAHCHLANLAQTHDLSPLISEANSHGIKGFISSILMLSEIDWHKNNPDRGILIQAGVHPSFDECDLAVEDISSLVQTNTLDLVGEIGIDRSNPDLEGQQILLTEQCRLAADAELPVSLHIVGHQANAYSLLKQFPLRYMVHGYAGSVEGFELLARLDTCFTICSRILKDDKRELLEAIIDDGRYLFETDITQYYVKPNEANPLLRLIELFQRVKQISGKTESELINTQNETLLHLLGRFPW